MNESNRTELESVRQRYYMAPILSAYQQAVADHGLPASVNHLGAVMHQAKDRVEALLIARRDAGEIRDVAQARKSIAGNGFQALVLCALGELQENGHLPDDIIFTLKTKTNSRLGESAIQVGPESVRPDVDLLVYSQDVQLPVCIYSLKTSLRERAGQTHRWKVLLDIVTSKNCRSIKKKYALHYSGRENFRMGLITPNFYDEITSPQQRGLLQFFDYVYLTKPGEFDRPVARFSEIVTDIGRLYG